MWKMEEEKKKRTTNNGSLCLMFYQLGFGFFFFQTMLCVWLIIYFIIKFGLTYYGKFELQNYQAGSRM